MGREQLEKISMRVPTGEGYIVGDILRKYALRSVGTWQVVGYKLDTQAVNFGMSNGSMVSYLNLLRGTLVCSHEHPPGDPVICNFVWNGQCFAYGDYELQGLDPSVGKKLTVCLAYGQGHSSADKNREVVRSVTEGSADGYFIVPSSHSPVTTFRYCVIPSDDKSEWLEIEADDGAVRRAIDAAVKTLSGLNQ